MSKKPVGLLWDSASNNIGDRAIGMLMRRFLEREGIPFETADPFSYDPAEYSSLIVGGGELIRPRGDPFYDRFRVRGAHILNTMGVYQPDDLEYLNQYRLVTVRSQADKSVLDPFVTGVKVCPCTTLVLGDFFDEPDNPRIAQTVETGDTIGVHFNLAIAHLIPDLIPVLHSLAQRHRIVLFPFTLYQRDRRIHEAIRRWLPDSPVSPLTDPADIYYAIGRMRAFVCVSLHGTMFAYAQNIPMLAYPTVPKISHFLEERGLGWHLFHTAEEMQGKLDKILAAPPDFSSAFKRDRKAVRSHLEEVAQLVHRPARARKTVQSESALRGQLALSIRAFHARWMEYLALWSQSTAERMESEHTVGQFAQRIDSLQSRIGEQEREAESRERAVRELREQAAEKDLTIQSLTAASDEKDRTIQSLTAASDEKDRTIQSLTAASDEKDRTIQSLTAASDEKDREIHEASVRAAEKDQRIRILAEESAAKDRRIRELVDQAAAKDRSILELSSHLAEIKGSTAWSIVRWLWRIRLFLLPHGSRREWVGAMAFRSVKVIRREGIGAFVRKVRETLRRARESGPQNPKRG
jgi:hypothetical protein